ncbi:hypothetical protein EVAR_17722_1 [Eumeta japonica]|uniref:Uncharacterized protein n=1 Tax=Eumeta variegata TaxID=151549 RepID=A0A4C1UTN4_EUMVA|nr:hypothetical protein EVAR_17722_1 [Eumeta japonica]
MNLTRENVRAVIFYDFSCNLSRQGSSDRLRLAFHDEAPHPLPLFVTGLTSSDVVVLIRLTICVGTSFYGGNNVNAPTAHDTD